MESVPTLSVSELECVRGERVLFSNLSFKLHDGEVLQIKGPNGCGKTSLLMMLCGIVGAHNGEIHWQGEEISSLGSDYRNALTFLGHKNAIKQRLTVSENIRIAAMINGGSSNMQLDNILKVFQLEKYTDTLCQDLSAGQRQRVALARTTLSCSRLWILDEPFTAIDDEGIHTMLSQISKHTEAGGMVIITTHNNSHLEKLGVKELDLS